ncbi:2TM domain-containing protein [Sediminicola luteus]|uniref:2TM domain-containing protein n=1 Tax=Sediminicola luteus TaxID=319238 RepID=A0A2A4G9K9_9FLAO|nr:2TM domain-containing protein [Sediminicola luteus]PCE64660.1 hypothetical protein B7P33_05665 [Sediminicola luteus]
MDQNKHSYERAQKRVQEIKNYYIFLTISIATVIMVGGINYYVNEWRYPWFLWVAFGCGLALVIGGIKIFAVDGRLGSHWEQKKIKEFMEREEQQNNSRWE